ACVYLPSFPTRRSSDLLERHEVIVEMAKIVAAVGDGHTNIYPTRDPKIGFHTLPVAFTFFGEELYVRAAHESQRSLVGARVLRIDRKSTRLNSSHGSIS